jgi:hypothetical protein
MNNGYDLQPLSSGDLLKLWESVSGSPHRMRAQTMIYYASSAKDRDDVSDWCIGEGDAFLLHLYRKIFGDQLDCIADCPACGEALELSLTVDDLLIDHGSGGSAYRVNVGNTPLELFFRLPNRKDLQDLPAEEPSETLRKRIVERCVLYAERQGEKISPVPLTDETIDMLAKAMSREDPQAEIRLHMQCPSCLFEWKTTFDIVDFLWQKINVEVKHLMHEIHVLAQAYGWTEFEILALSGKRRKHYLELVGS